MYGNTALHYAVLKGNIKLIKFLIEEHNAETNIRNTYNELPIDMCSKENTQVIEYLNSKNMFFTNELEIKRPKQKSKSVFK